MTCPFCLRNDFDDVGLKWHFEAGHCDAFNEVPCPHSPDDNRDARAQRAIKHRPNHPCTPSLTPSNAEKPAAKTGQQSTSTERSSPASVAPNAT